MVHISNKSNLILASTNFLLPLFLIFSLFCIHFFMYLGTDFPKFSSTMNNGLESINSSYQKHENLLASIPMNFCWRPFLKICIILWQYLYFAFPGSIFCPQQYGTNYLFQIQHFFPKLTVWVSLWYLSL